MREREREEIIEEAKVRGERGRERADDGESEEGEHIVTGERERGREGEASKGGFDGEREREEEA